MRVRSVALKTALMIQRLYGLVEDRPGYAVLRTPSVPDFWYGNCLAVPGPLRAEAHGTWMRRFAVELPGHGHRVFLVDAPEGDPGDVQAFLDDGFEVNACDVLATSVLRRPEALTCDFAFRPLSGDCDWAAVVETSFRANEGGRGHDRGFLQRKFGAVRRAVEQGSGIWWGAWDGARLVADMGLFWEDGLVRFQDVETLPEYRRRGICRSLLSRACEQARESLGDPLFVIVPVDDTVRRIYESVGFTARERTVDLFRMPPSEPSRPAGEETVSPVLSPSPAQDPGHPRGQEEACLP